MSRRTAYDITETVGQWGADPYIMKATILKKLYSSQPLTEIEILWLACEAKVVVCDCAGCIEKRKNLMDQERDD